VIRSPGATPFDHTSMIRTLSLRWGLGSLTGRDRAAPDFGAVFALGEREARLDTPAVTPRPYTPISSAGAHETPLSGMQQEFAALVAHHLGGRQPAAITKVGEFLRLGAAPRP
jgi:hypothetical protein